MKRFKRIVMQPIESISVRALFGIVRLLPTGLAVRLGGWAGSAAFSLLRIRRKIALKNLETALPDASESERIAIGRRSYANLGRSLMEIILLGRVGPDYLKSHITFEGIEHLDKVLEKGRGCMAITGHFGSWEMMAAAVSQGGYPLDLLIGEQKNKRVDDLFNALRSRHGLGLIPLDQALRGVLRALKNNRTVALLGDQEARRGAGIEVTFFDRPTSTYPGAALFAIKGKSSMVCPFIVRQGTGPNHKVYVTPPLEFEVGENRDEAIRDLTQRHTSCLEDWIRKYPDHWFWGHKRWKSMGLYRDL